MRLVDADLAPLYLNDSACEQIKRMPTITTESLKKHAYWKAWLDSEGKLICYMCSNCNTNHNAFADTKFCPNCGCKMDLENKQ